jgi:hypothetical protein
MKLIKTLQSKALFTNAQPDYPKMYKGIKNKGELKGCQVSK